MLGELPPLRRGEHVVGKIADAEIADLVVEAREVRRVAEA